MMSKNFVLNKRHSSLNGIVSNLIADWTGLTVTGRDIRAELETIKKGASKGREKSLHSSHVSSEWIRMSPHHPNSVWCVMVWCGGMVWCDVAWRIVSYLRGRHPSVCRRPRVHYYLSVTVTKAKGGERPTWTNRRTECIANDKRRRRGLRLTLHSRSLFRGWGREDQLVGSLWTLSRLA